jgi:hypothetical protein
MEKNIWEFRDALWTSEIFYEDRISLGGNYVCFEFSSVCWSPRFI